MKRSLWAAGGQGCAFLLQLCSVVYIARRLGPDAQGEFATIRSAVFMGEAFVWIGLNSGLSYLVAKSPEQFLNKLFRVSFWHLVGCCLGLVILGMTLGQTIPNTHWAISLLRSHLAEFVCWLFGLGAMQVSVRTLLATQKYLMANLVSILSAGLALLFVLVTPGSMTLELVLDTQIAAATCSAALGAFWIFRNFGCRAFCGRPSWKDWAEGVKAGANGLASTVAFMGLYRTDLFLIATFCDKKTSGVYAVASFTVEALQRASDWFAAVLTPMVASGKTTGVKEALRNSWMGIGIVLSLALALYILFLGGHDPFVAGLGVEYTQVSTMVLLFLPKACLHCVMVSYAGVLAGRGYTIYHPAAGVGALVVLLTLGGYFGSVFGYLGVITGLTSAYLVATGIMIVGTRNTRLISSNSI